MTGTLCADPEPGVNTVSPGPQAPRDFKALTTSVADYVPLILDKLGLEGEYEGDEFVFLAPWRDDQALGACQFNIIKGIGKDFADDKPFDIIDLWSLVYKCTKAQAYDSIRALLEELKQTPLDPDAVARRKKQQEKTNETNRYTALHSVWRNKHIQSLTGSDGLKYFQERGILIPDGIAARIKFAPSMWHKETKTNCPAIILPIKRSPIDIDDDLIAVHRIYLTPDCTGKIANNAKKALGSFKGGGVWFGDISRDTLYVTEGPENALVALMAGCPFVVSAVTGGNMADLSIPDHVTTVIIIPDNDPAGIKYANAAAESYRKHWLSETTGEEIEHHIDVFITNLPTVQGRKGKVDLNDVLTFLRLDAVKHLCKSVNKYAASDDEKFFFKKTLEALEFMNKRHGAVFDGTKIMYSHLAYNPVHQQYEIKYVDRNALLAMYENRFVQIVPTNENENETGKKSQLAQWWLRQSKRTQFEGRMCDPSKERIITINNKQYLNEWGGFAIKPERGEWKLFLKHIYTILCRKDPTSFKYAVKWIAWLFQNPHIPAEVIWVNKGKKGTGKGLVGNQIRKIFGIHAAQVKDRERLIGRFNPLLAVCFLFADEAFWPGDVKSEGILKGITTEETLEIEQKFKDVRISRNMLHMYMASNEDWVIPAGENERRYFVEEVVNTYARGVASDEVRNSYFSRIYHQMDNGGRGGMLYDLLDMKLGDWHPRDDVPNTKALQKQIATSRSYYKECMFSLLDEGNLIMEYSEAENGYLCASKAIQTFFNVEDDASKSIKLMKGLRPIFEKLGIRKSETKRRSGSYWVFPELHELRKRWNNEFSGSDGWPVNDAAEWRKSDI